MGASHVVGSAAAEKLPDCPPGQGRLSWQHFAVGENELRLVRGLECGVHVPSAFLKLIPSPPSKDPDCAAGCAINECHWPRGGAVLFSEALRNLLPELLRGWLDVGGQAQVNRYTEGCPNKNPCWHGPQSDSTMPVQQDRKSTRLNSSHLGISYAV